MNPFEITVARRLAWKQPGRRKQSPAVAVAVTGTALAMMVMLLSVAVMLGFKREVSARLLSLDNAITITGYNSDNSITTFPPAEVLAAITLPPGAETEGSLSAFGILKTPDDFTGLNLRSASSAPPADSLIWISRATAAKLRLEKGSRVPVYFFIDRRLRVRALTVDSLYQTPFAEHDDAVAYVAAPMLEQLLAIPAGHVSSIGITNVDPERIEPLASAIHSSLLSAFYSGDLTTAYGISTIFQTDAAFFSWLSLLDTNVVVILALMGAVAAFTLISSLFIIILERVRTIGLLKALGASNAQVRRIFMLMAERLVVRGLLLGNALGLGLIALQAATRAIPLDPASYYVDFVPVSIDWTIIVGLNIAAVALSWLVLMLPALIVSRISPATTMRYE